MYIPPAELVVYETEHWLVNHCVDSTLPGYLILSSRRSDAERLARLPPQAQEQLGGLLSRLDEALDAVLSPTRVYVARWGHTPQQSVHFHVIPLYPWLVKAAAADERYQHLLTLHGEREVDRADSFDGTDLTLYIVREFLERKALPPSGMLSVEEAIRLLRKHLAQSGTRAP